MPGWTETVGRVTERALVRLRVAGLLRENGGAVLIGGEPGIGKTRLALDAAEEGRRRGLTVAWGRCREAGTAPPFWPWVQVLRHVVEAEGWAAVHQRHGAAADDVLRLTGEAGVSSGRGPASSALGPSQRIRLFDGVTDLLTSSRRPTLVVLDDLHRADDASLALLRHLGGESWPPRVLVLVTYRQTEDPYDRGFPATLAALASGCSCDEVLLGPLDPVDARLVACHAGGTLSEADLAAVVTRGGGNPFFLQQLGRAVAAGSPPSQVPASVGEVVRHRLACLPDTCRELLQVLSVAGRQADVAVVADLARVDRGDVLAALVPAVTGGLLTVTHEGDALQFAHALVHEALYGDLDPKRRARLHERLAEWLRACPSPDAGVAADLADHALKAARGGRPVDPVPPLRTAAEAAVRSLAFEEATRLLELAVHECRQPAVRVALLQEAGHALASGGRPADARVQFERAVREATRLGDVRAVAAATLGVGACVVPVGETDWDLVALLEGALCVRFDDRSVHARLRARLAVELYWHDGEVSRRQSALALEAAESSEDVGALTEALHARLFTLRGPDQSEERLALGRRLVALAVEHRLDDIELRGWVFWLPELLRAADLPGYRAGVRRMTTLADRSRQPLHRWYAELFTAQLAMIAGAVEEASIHSAAAARVARRLGLEAGDVYLIGQQVVLSRDIGGIDTVVEPLTAVADRFPRLVTMRVLLAVVLAESGRTQEAGAQLTNLAASRFAALPRDSLWLATVCYAAEAAHLLGDPAVARSSVELLEPYRGSCAVQGLPVCWGAVDRAVGLAHLTLGEVDRAVEALHAALDLHERWGMPALAARTELDLAVAYATGGPPRRSSAVLHARRAQTQARGLGLHRLDLLVEELTESLSAVRMTTRLKGPGGALSSREEDILRLLADGASNKAIAQELFISLNTVERHVRNVYAKLGVSNRAAATAFAVRAELTTR